MKRVVIFATCILLICKPSCAKHLNPEKYYQEQWCTKHKGQAEYVLPDKTRVDCLTDKYAVEFDFANKWAECIGQALYYGKMTGKQPACALIMERGELDNKYLNRLNKTIEGLNIEVFTVTPANKCF